VGGNLDSFGQIHVDPELLKAATKRAFERAQRGETVPAPSLPDDKSSHPKLLCLDFNKWIDLGRAHFGKPEGARFKEALAAVREAIAAGRLLVPAFPTNAIEAMEPSDPARRRRIAEFVVDLSGNSSFAANHVVLRRELRAALDMLTEGGASAVNRASLVRRGLSAAISGRELRVATGDARVDALVEEAMLDPTISVEALFALFDRESLAAMRQREQQFAVRLAELRDANAGISATARTRSELTNLFSEGSVANLLREVVGESVAVPFFPWLTQNDNIVRFAAAVPSIDVEMTLLLEREKNRDHAPHRNDPKDLAFLKLALPYGNVVVTERSWAHLCTSTGLATKYATKVLADASDLPAVLRAEGCI